MCVCVATRCDFVVDATSSILMSPRRALGPCKISVANAGTAGHPCAAVGCQCVVPKEGLNADGWRHGAAGCRQTRRRMDAHDRQSSALSPRYRLQAMT